MSKTRERESSRRQARETGRREMRPVVPRDEAKAGEKGPVQTTATFASSGVVTSREEGHTESWQNTKSTIVG